MTIRAVGGVVLRDTPTGKIEVLLIKKQGGMWTLPKGRVKRGEGNEAALLRELAEETGLQGMVGEVVSQAAYQVVKGGKLRRKKVVYYLVWGVKGELRPGMAEGIEAVRWMSVPHALKHIGRPRIRAIVRSALTMMAL